MSWLSNALGIDKKKETATLAARKKAADPATGRNRYLDAMQPLAAGTQAAEQRYTSQAGFDPGAAFQGFAQGAWGQAMDGFGRKLDALKGASVGAGRFDTGYFDQDTGDLARETVGDFGRTIAGGALQAAGMQQQQNQYLGNYAMESRNRFLDAASGQRDHEQGIEEAKAGRKAQGKAGIWGAAGSLGGGILGRIF